MGQNCSPCTPPTTPQEWYHFVQVTSGNNISDVTRQTAGIFFFKMATMKIYFPMF